MIKDHMDLLGFKVTDTVTGFTGVVTSVAFDLAGCVQAIVVPAVGENGKAPEALWLDTKRLKPIGKKPVMAPHDFDGTPVGQEPGPETKPSLPSKQLRRL